MTGAGSGIGRAIAERFAGVGAKVIVNDVDDETATDTTAAIVASGGTALTNVATGGPSSVTPRSRRIQSTAR